MKNNENHINIMTVKDNTQDFLHRQINRATNILELLHYMEYHMTNDVKVTIRMNLILNNLAATEDVVGVEKIYNKDITSLKGKSNQNKPMPVRNDTIELANEL